MSNITIREDINELFADVDELVKALVESYEQAKGDSSVLHVSRVKVKSALEHLRSILDYCAADAYVYVYRTKPKKLYFPYGINEQLFNKHLSKSFTSLREKNPKIYGLIASLQPHVSGSNWCVDLCNYTNVNKHNNLTPQVRKTQDSVTIGNLIKMSGNSTVTIVNSTVNGIPIGKDLLTEVRLSDSMTDEQIKEQLNPGNPFLPVTRKADSIKFFIDGSDNDVLAFLQGATARVNLFTRQLYAEIGS
jgi:hypothetical protein